MALAGGVGMGICEIISECDGARISGGVARREPGREEEEAEEESGWAEWTEGRGWVGRA
jgi:hypothetical protein